MPASKPVNESSSAATKEEILSSGVAVAGLFFKNVFGDKADKALSAFVAFRLVASHLDVVWS